MNIKRSFSEEVINKIAEVCHDANRSYCETIGDHSQVSWFSAPEWQKNSARKGVILHLLNDVGPEASHVSWMQEKLDDGWIFGPVKNPDKKQHPCMVDFNTLPAEQQMKDHLFRAIVHAFKGIV